jgi:hypothetical protein
MIAKQIHYNFSFYIVRKYVAFFNLLFSCNNVQHIFNALKDTILLDIIYFMLIYVHLKAYRMGLKLKYVKKNIVTY